MLYNHNSLGTILILAILAYLSFLDKKFRQIENYEIIPSLIIGLSCGIYKTISTGFLFQYQLFLYYIIGFVISVFLYAGGFFGGADLKIYLILLLIVNPTKSYGITSNMDGLQLFYYYFISIFMFFLMRLIRNIIVRTLTRYRNNTLLNARETLFLSTFYRLQKFNQHIEFESIILMINSKDLKIQQSFNLRYGIVCWTYQPIPMIPFITISLMLTVFT